MPRKTVFLAAVLFIFGFFLGMPFYHIPTFTKGPLICALIGQERGILEIFLKPHYWTYRPLLVLIFSTLYKLFGFHYEPYRIFAATISGFFALTVYLFLLELQPLRKIAFFSTLIFTLTTPYLDGLWDLSEGGFYATFFFYAAFLFFVKIGKCDGNHNAEKKCTALFLLFSTLCLLTKETHRAMAPPILFLYCYFMKANQKQWKLFWIFCVLSVLTLLPMLSAPPDPGSRAAVTTPFWEVAKISFQINVTQLMSIFPFVVTPVFLIYGVITGISKLKNRNNLNEQRVFSTINKLAFFDLATDVLKWAFACIFVGLAAPTFRVPEYITYFSAKYYPDNSFWIFDIHCIVLFIALILIFTSETLLERFFISSIIFTFFSYYIEMTFIPTFRLEPSSRHYLIIAPLLAFLIANVLIKTFIKITERKLWEKIFMYPIWTAVCFLIIWSYAGSAGDLKSEFYAIGNSEFKAWSFLQHYGLKDAAIFSPADGYALPPEYLELAAPEKHFAFFQLPRWFSTLSDLESHLHRTLDKNNLQSAKKVFYYSGFDSFKGDYSDKVERPYYGLPYGAYDKIGYWKHILVMHGVIDSISELYMMLHAKLVYKDKQSFYDNGMNLTREYITRIYVMDNEQSKSK